MRQVIAPDGRRLDVLHGGKHDDVQATLVVCHGTPGDATSFADWDDAASARHVQLVAVSRPGYAHSTRQRGRSVASVAADVSFVLDSLGVSTFVVAGHSGGGPHALACAALLPDRCRRAASLAGVAPYGVADLDWMAGMGPENVEEFGMALTGEEQLGDWVATNGAPLRHVTGEDLVAALGGLVPQVDKDVLAGGYATRMADSTRRALDHGYDGWVDDDLAFTQDWGFDVASVTVPVTVWQGDLDLMVPKAHGEWLAAHLPNARYRAPEGQGHLSLVTALRDEILDDLLQ